MGRWLTTFVALISALIAGDAYGQSGLAPAAVFDPLTGCQLAPLNAPVSCTFYVAGQASGPEYTMVTLSLTYWNNGGGAATGYDMIVEEGALGGPYFVLAGQSFDVTTGVLTIAPMTVHRTFSGAGVSETIAWTIGLNARHARLRITGLGAPNVHDLITVTARVVKP